MTVENNSTSPGNTRVVVYCYSDVVSNVVFIANQDFVDLVKTMANVCKASGLSKASISMAPGRLGPPGVNEKIDLVESELVVRPAGYFSFYDEINGGNEHIETVAIGIDELSNAIAKAQPGEVLFFPDTMRDVLQREYEEDERFIAIQNEAQEAFAALRPAGASPDRDRQGRD